jgi:peptidoglycan/LPS O-acetylase OafA/YrhL
VREHDNHGRINLLRFYARRALRLGPALLLLLAVLVIIALLFFDGAEARNLFTDVLITLAYGVNWARAFGLHPPELLAHAWSLSVEEQFYLVWPVILIPVLRSGMSRRLLVALILSAAAASWLWRIALTAESASAHRVYNGLDTRADALLIGCALGCALASNLIDDKIRARMIATGKILTPFTVLFIAGTVVFSNWQAHHAYYWLLGTVEVLVALTILQVLVCPRSLMRSCLSFRPLVWIGTISYGLYLWHFPIYSLFHSLGMTFKGMIAGTVVSVAIAALSYYAIERPVLKLKNRLASETLVASSTGLPRDWIRVGDKLPEELTAVPMHSPR